MVRELRAKLVREKETRNMIVYTEIATYYLGNLYVRRESFNGGRIPSKIEVVIEWDNVPESP